MSELIATNRIWVLLLGAESKLKRLMLRLQKTKDQISLVEKTFLREHRRAGQDWGAEKMNGTDV